ncbi:hypothetical protein HYW76_01790 [Candidatus Pacearchaeota archaeon]|nr:hypothetical protein [Candidatus Pacearchaeota archaeon]
MKKENLKYRNLKISVLSEIRDFRALSGIRGIPEAFVPEELQDGKKKN